MFFTSKTFLEALCFLWYMFKSFKIGISFHADNLLSYILQCQFGNLPIQSKHLFTLLEWFIPAHQWTQRLTTSLKPYAVIMFRRPCSLLPPATMNQQKLVVYYCPRTFIHMTSTHQVLLVKSKILIFMSDYDNSWQQLIWLTQKASQPKSWIVQTHWL